MAPSHLDFLMDGLILAAGVLFLMVVVWKSVARK
jgi:hypothetical protein